MTASSKLNLGCGFTTPSGWINVDGAFGARLAKIPTVSRAARALGLVQGEWSEDIVIQDLRRPLAFSDGQFDFVYLSHVLEHFRYLQGQELLKECLRVLSPGGILRVVVPDLNFYVERYRSGALRAEDFLSKLSTHPPDTTSRIKSFLKSLSFFPHLCMYDARSLLGALRAAGFSELQLCRQFDSWSVDITDVEGTNAGEGTLIAEGRAPQKKEARSPDC